MSVNGEFSNSPTLSAAGKTFHVSMGILTPIGTPSRIHRGSTQTGSPVLAMIASSKSVLNGDGGKKSNFGWVSST
eukprot:4173570-Heterocapsa_arctica.AAC.1